MKKREKKERESNSSNVYTFFKITRFKKE